MFISFNINFIEDKDFNNIRKIKIVLIIIILILLIILILYSILLINFYIIFKCYRKL